MHVLRPARSLLASTLPLRCLTGLLLVLTMGLAACDSGIAPPEEPPGFGTLRGTIRFASADPADWPALDSLRDLRFVALPFVPRDTADIFSNLTELVISPGLARFVAVDSFLIDSVKAQVYPFSGVAQQFSRNLFDWRPVGLYEENSGAFIVRPGETTHVEVRVDFRNPPPFPPGTN